ncbi:MAG: hypothetical protein ABSD59_15625 [Terracidiphilus sp.]|jgi:hypothetical protein
MSRVIFDNTPTAPTFNTTRADVACFVGLVRLLPGASLPATTVTWLSALGYSAAQIASLTNIPVMVEGYLRFTSIFDDGSAGTGFGTDYLAAGVRSFFAQGGKRCYVVRVDDPVTPNDAALNRANKLMKVLPNTTFAPDQPQSWTGVGSLAPLEEVSILVTPDLPILSASQPFAAGGQAPSTAAGPEEFVVCAKGDISPRQASTFSSPAPRLALADYTRWAASVASILNYLSGGYLTHQLHLREIQFVTSFPIPQDNDPAAVAANPSAAEIAQDIHAVIQAQMPETPPPQDAVSPGNISSSFLQLAYPWVKTSNSGILLESLEAPDGVLAGLLARNALTRGTFTSATKITPSEVYDIYPALPAQEIETNEEPLIWGDLPNGQPMQPKALIERLSLFGFTPDGLRLLSDVTAYPGESYRAGPVARLCQVICRAARQMGETAVFQNNGPALWGSVQRFLQNLMTRLWNLNALDGATSSDAFTVRCDSSTMTQNDLDNGRVIAYVTFNPASMIEQITVKLAMETSGTSTQEIAANLLGAF